MKLLSDWIILNLGATLAFSALWVAVVVVVAAFMGVRAGFVRVVGWVSGLFARKRDPIRIGAAATDEHIRTDPGYAALWAPAFRALARAKAADESKLADRPVLSGNPADVRYLPQGFSPWIAGSPAPAPDQFFGFNDKWQGRGRKPVAAGPDWWRRFFELVAADDARRAAGAAMAHDDRSDAGAGKPIVVGSAEWLASCPVRDWRGTGGAREDRETVIEATWQGRGRGFATTTLPVVQ